MVTGTCKPRCKTCGNSASDCLTCTKGENRLLSPPDCACKEGYHDKEGSEVNCSPCP